MSVYLAIPSKKQPAEAEAVLSVWRARGYKLAIWRDTGDTDVQADILVNGTYPGYYSVVNVLAREVFQRDPDAQWIVAAGDDMEPDPTHPPQQIAEECTVHFGGTFGVMQPTGDRWGAAGRVYAEHICGSPWLGREFCQRMYGGRGPYFDDYYHMFGDEELMNVAQRLGVLWQRPDLVHLHRHWARERRPMPDYLKRANEGFVAAQKVFSARQAAGFPGHEPARCA